MEHRDPHVSRLDRAEPVHLAGSGARDRLLALIHDELPSTLVLAHLDTIAVLRNRALVAAPPASAFATRASLYDWRNVFR